MISAAWISMSRPGPALLHGGLVDEDARVRQREALAGRSRGGEHGGGRGGLAEHDRLDVRADVLHRVVDRRHRGEGATGRVDVHDDVAVRVLALEHEELGHDVVRGGVVDLDAEEDDAVLEELGVRVLALVAVGRALLERGEDVARGRCGSEPNAVPPKVGVVIVCS